MPEMPSEVPELSLAHELPDDSTRPAAGRGLFIVSRNATVYLIANGLQRGVSVLIMPLLLARLSMTDYGRYGLLLTIFILASPLVSLALPAAIGRFYFDSGDPKVQRQIVSTLLLSQVVCVVSLTALLDFLLGSWFRNIGDLEYSLVHLALWTAAALSLYEGVVIYWRAAEKPLAVAVSQISSFGATTAAVALLLFHYNMGLRGVALGFLVGQGAVSITSLTVALLQTGLAWRKGLLREALRFSLPLVPHCLMTWALRAADRWILMRWRGGAELGLYVFSYQLASVVTLFMSSANDALSPRFMAHYRDAGAEGADLFHRRAFPIYCWLAVGVASTLILLAPVAAPIMSRGKFAYAPLLTALLATAIVASAMYAPFANALVAMKATARLTAITVSCGALNVVLNLALVPSYGATGAALAMATSSLVLMGSTIYVANRWFRLDRQVPQLAAAAAVLFVVMRLARA